MDCFHCGNEDLQHQIVSNDKTFCCNGCLMVFELLQENGLDNYYSIENKPGKRPMESEGHLFDFLKNKTISDSLFEFSEGDVKIVTLFLPDIHCSSCIWLLENLRTLNTGVQASEVNFVRKTATITFNDNEISLEKLCLLLLSIGYKPTFQTENKEASDSNKLFYQKLGVAGFCFGNIMLLSFPEYFGSDDSFQTEFRNFFSYLILGLSIPILLFSSVDYLRSAFKAIRIKTLNLDVPIAIGIITLYTKSTTDIILENGPGYMDSFAGFIFFLLLGKWFQQSTYQALSFERDYRSYFPLAVTKIIDNQEEVVAIDKIKIGDILFLRNNEILPADGILLSDQAQIDYSFVTGESNAILKQQHEKIFAGGKVLGSAIQIRATKTVEQSYLTGLWNKNTFKPTSKDQLTLFSEKVSKWFVFIILLVSLLSGIIWWFIESESIINVITSVLIVACPCALALSIPFTFGNAIRIYGRNKLYLKNSSVISELNEITDIIFDKTGTITTQESSIINYEGQPLSDFQEKLIFSLSKNSTHPLATHLYRHIKTSNNYQNSFNTINFREDIGQGLFAEIQGVKVKMGSARYVSSSSMKNGSNIFISLDNNVVGAYSFKHSFRAGIKEILSTLKNNFELHLLSGDNDNDRGRLLAHFPNACQIHFEQKPIDKLNYVKGLQKQGSRVLMIGDGLNDSGALMQSNAGFIVTDDIFNFSPACDGILDAAALKKLPQFLAFSKRSKTVLIWSYVISLLYNLIGLYFAITNQLSPIIAAILMPISSISIVIFTTIATRLIASRSIR